MKWRDPVKPKYFKSKDAIWLYSMQRFAQNYMVKVRGLFLIGKLAYSFQSDKFTLAYYDDWGVLVWSESFRIDKKTRRDQDEMKYLIQNLVIFFYYEYEWDWHSMSIIDLGRLMGISFQSMSARMQKLEAEIEMKFLQHLWYVEEQKERRQELMKWQKYGFKKIYSHLIRDFIQNSDDA